MSREAVGKSDVIIQQNMKIFNKEKRLKHVKISKKQKMKMEY